MHVITGRFKGMPLATPRAETRPTTDRTKEALFSRLEAHGLLRDARVLDLFGGTGALGIEALSRGARELVTVESSAQAAQLIAQLDCHALSKADRKTLIELGWEVSGDHPRRIG